MSGQAWVVVASDTPDERTVPVEGRLLVGRECVGADAHKCLILEDPLVWALLLDVAPLRRLIPSAVALVRLVQRVEPHEVAFSAALSGDFEVGFDPDGRVPQVGELRPLEEDTVGKDYELRRAADAQHVRPEALEIESIEVVALRRQIPAGVPLRAL